MLNENKLYLIDTLRNYCIENNIYFIAGEQDYVNAVTDSHIYAEYELILIADLTFSPRFENSALDSVVYSGTIALGRKREDTTASTLDETYIQKYDNRLKDLSKYLVQILEEIECKYDASVDNATMSYQLNSYDLNIDAVAANIQITL